MSKKVYCVNCGKNASKKAEYDLAVHHGTCGFCEEKNCLVVHYNYSEQEEAGKAFSLCTKCLGRGLVAFQHPLSFPARKEK